jgi:hypothetical protein
LVWSDPQLIRGAGVGWIFFILCFLQDLQPTGRGLQIQDCIFFFFFRGYQV